MLNIAVSCFIWFKFNKFYIVNNKRLISNLSEIDNILKENEFLVQENTRLESIYQENKVLVQKNAELEKNIFKQSEELIHIKAELENMCQKNIKLDRDVKNFKTRATDNQKCILFLLYKKLSAQYKIVSRKEFFHYLNKDLKEEKCPTQLKSIHFIESLCDKNLEFEFTAKGNNNVKNDS